MLLLCAPLFVLVRPCSTWKWLWFSLQLPWGHYQWRVMPRWFSKWVRNFGYCAKMFRHIADFWERERTKKTSHTISLQMYVLNWSFDAVTIWICYTPSNHPFLPLLPQKSATPVFFTQEPEFLTSFENESPSAVVYLKIILISNTVPTAHTHHHSHDFSTKNCTVFLCGLLGMYT